MLEGLFSLYKKHTNLNKLKRKGAHTKLNIMHRTRGDSCGGEAKQRFEEEEEEEREQKQEQEEGTVTTRARMKIIDLLMLSEGVRRRRTAAHFDLPDLGSDTRERVVPVSYPFASKGWYSTIARQWRDERMRTRTRNIFRAKVVLNGAALRKTARQHRVHGESVLLSSRPTTFRSEEVLSTAK
jgi:hypothetical protein